MHDFVYYMRHGVPGKFEGLGEKILLTWDSTGSDQQRLFHLLNGGEYEHAMYRDTGLYSSNLDRMLLWFERGQTPNLTFVSNKLPNAAYHNGKLEDIPNEPGYLLSGWRLEMASANMGTGYSHSDAARGNAKVVGHPGVTEERARYGGEPLPLDYDEYRRGKDGVYGWLGQPTGAPQRFSGHLGAPVYRFDAKSKLPQVTSSDARWQGSVERLASSGIRFNVKSTGPFGDKGQQFTFVGQLPLDGVNFKAQKEYTLRFKARGSSTYGSVAERYRPIPRGLCVRLRAADAADAVGERDKVRRKKKAGLDQEFLLFEKERTASLTLVSPIDGAGVLEICLSESPGSIEFLELELFEGSGDVLFRKFEHGLVVLNGSKDSAVSLPMAKLVPSESYRRLDGKQDPEHNNGQPVAARLEIPEHDAFFLLKQ